MATTKELHDYVLEQLQKTGNVTTGKMMDEYCVYYNGKMVGDICDNTLLLKRQNCNKAAAGTEEKEMILIDLKGLLLIRY